MAKCLPLQKISLLGLLVSGSCVYSMEHAEDSSPQERGNSHAKLARLKSLQEIPPLSHVQFRQEELSRKQAALKQEEDARYEHEVVQEFKREQQLLALREELLKRESQGGPHVQVFSETVKPVSDLLAIEANKYLEDAFDDEVIPSTQQTSHLQELHFANAIKMADIALVKELVGRKVSLAIHDELGNTPLHWAISTDLNEQQKIDLMKILIAGGANINAANNAGQTPVHMVALALHDTPALLQFMREQSALADVALMDMEGQTPLHVAVTKGRMDLIKLLLASNVQVDAKNLKGLTPLQLVLESALQATAKRSIITDLIEAGADLDVRDEQRDPLLFKAIKKVDVISVEILLGNGANFDARDIRNRTALEYAQHKIGTSTNENTKVIVQLLEDYMNGVRTPQRTTEHTPMPDNFVKIIIPGAHKNEIDKELLKQNCYAVLQEFETPGKTRLQGIIERSLKKVTSPRAQHENAE